MYQFYDFYFDIRRKFSVIRRDAIHAVWVRNGSNQADINRFRGNTGKTSYKGPFLTVIRHTLSLGLG